MTAKPALVWALAGLVLLEGVLLIVTNREALFGTRESASLRLGAPDRQDFHALSIPELPSNTRPRIVTEGYVRDVRLDREEGTLHFTLVEDPRGTGPFVVCEIVGPTVLAAPREGSRVRVYGVARFDAQPGRGWHEVNPVLDIAVLKRD